MAYPIEGEIALYGIVVVSNREPWVHRKKGGRIACEQPSGGLVSALDPVMRRSGGTWVAWGSGNADRGVSDAESRARVPEEDPSYTLKRVWLTNKEISGYYYGFCNRVLWPISHSFREKAQFKKEYWKAYKRVNNKFTKAVLEEIRNDANVWVHDFHLSLVPKCLRDKREDVSIAYFWHVPFPPWEVFSTIPWRKEILRGLLGCDLIGFHTRSYVDNFLSAVEKELSSPVLREEGIVENQGQITLVKPFPISIDYEKYRLMASSREIKHNAARLRRKLRTHWIIFGVDRLDYTKGILRRLLAYERFLERNPGYRGKVCFVQVAAPSRTKVQEYRMMKKEIDETVGRINGRFQRPNWAPIIYIYRHIPTEELITFYKVADVAMVTPLIDGMNLVAKEYVTVKDDGVLILSEFAGASQELRDALLVNPYDVDKTARAISEAMAMSKEKRQKHIRVLREKVKEHDVHRWLERFLKEWGVEPLPVITAC